MEVKERGGKSRKEEGEMDPHTTQVVVISTLHVVASSLSPLFYWDKSQERGYILLFYVYRGSVSYLC